MPDFADAFRKAETERPDGPIVVTGDASRYALAALADECEQVRTAPQGTRNDQLNRSAFKMGTLIGAGKIDEHTVIQALGAADGGLDYPATRSTIASGIRNGIDSPRQIAERPRELAPFEQSENPLLPGYVPPESTTGEQTWGRDDGATGSAVNAAGPSNADAVRTALPLIDWHALWADETEEEWIVEPLLAARRQVALYSAPKVGKSLLLLEIAQAVSRGQTVLGSSPKRPYRVLYVDFENDPLGDVRQRLRNMYVGPGDLDNLCYLSFPTIGTLDSERGSVELLAAVQVYGCEVVVIDTVSRAIAGEESASDTWLAFYRHTGLKLKQLGVALIRLDHSGKDESKGQRGSSAKSGDVDAVWKLARITNATDDHVESFRLTNEAARMQINAADKLLTLERHMNPLRTIIRPAGAKDLIVDAIVDYLDDTDCPLDRSNRAEGFLTEVKTVVPGASFRTLEDAIKRRRGLNPNVLEHD